MGADPYYSDGQASIYLGDALTVLRGLPSESVNCIVTSPPYWGLRDYGVEGQMGSEESLEAWLGGQLGVFAEARRVLRADGTCWVNIGDSYAEKNLVGQPWALAFALRADGWYLRSEIIWHKLNPMPEAVTDRPTRSHEQLFMLTKSPRYWYDQDAIKEPASPGTRPRFGDGGKRKAGTPKGDLREVRDRGNSHAQAAMAGYVESRNKRTVWATVADPYPRAHFATFPEALVVPCILAGCPEGGVVLDPFLGSGTTAAVAKRLGRRAIGIELNPEYCDLAAGRVAQMGMMPIES